MVCRVRYLQSRESVSCSKANGDIVISCVRLLVGRVCSDDADVASRVLLLTYEESQMHHNVIMAC